MPAGCLWIWQCSVPLYPALVGFCSSCEQWQGALTCVLAPAGGRGHLWLRMKGRRSWDPMQVGSVLHLARSRREEAASSMGQDSLKYFSSGPLCCFFLPLFLKHRGQWCTCFSFRLSQSLPPFKVAVLNLANNSMRSSHFSVLFYF